jgi:hypothetical protein
MWRSSSLGALVKPVRVVLNGRRLVYSFGDSGYNSRMADLSKRNRKR